MGFCIPAAAGGLQPFLKSSYLPILVCQLSLSIAKLVITLLQLCSTCGLYVLQLPFHVTLLLPTLFELLIRPSDNILELDDVSSQLLGGFFSIISTVHTCLEFLDPIVLLVQLFVLLFQLGLQLIDVLLKMLHLLIIALGIFRFVLQSFNQLVLFVELMIAIPDFCLEVLHIIFKALNFFLQQEIDKLKEELQIEKMNAKK